METWRKVINLGSVAASRGQRIISARMRGSAGTLTASGGSLYGLANPLTMLPGKTAAVVRSVVAGGKQFCDEQRHRRAGMGQAAPDMAINAGEFDGRQSGSDQRSQ